MGYVASTYCDISLLDKYGFAPEVQEAWWKAVLDYFSDLFDMQRLLVVQGDTAGADLSFYYMYDIKTLEFVEQEFHVSDVVQFKATYAPIDAIALLGHEVWHARQISMGLAWLREHDGKFEPERDPGQLGRAALYAVAVETYINIGAGETVYRRQLLEAEAYVLSEKIDQRIGQCLMDACDNDDLEVIDCIRQLRVWLS